MNHIIGRKKPHTHHVIVAFRGLVRMCFYVSTKSRHITIKSIFDFLSIILSVLVMLSFSMASIFAVLIARKKELKIMAPNSKWAIVVLKIS